MFRRGRAVRSLAPLPTTPVFHGRSCHLAVNFRARWRALIQRVKEAGGLGGQRHGNGAPDPPARPGDHRVPAVARALSYLPPKAGSERRSASSFSTACFELHTTDSISSNVVAPPA